MDKIRACQQRHETDLAHLQDDISLLEREAAVGIPETPESAQTTDFFMSAANRSESDLA